MFTLRYFSITDPVTGKISKSYGYSYSRIEQNITIKHDRVIRGEARQGVKHVVPNNSEELTKEQFDLLDTSEESLLSRLSREKHFLYLKRFAARISQPVVPVSDTELIEKIKKKKIK